MKRTIRVFSLLLAAVMLLSAQALATEPAQAFTDVSKQDYFYDAVNWAVEKEITSGVSKDVFAPNRDCTRADFVTFLWRAAGKPVVNYAMNFSDVKESSYYAEAVRWAASLGIVTGFSQNTFGAAAAVTREQAVTMLWRFAKQQGFDTTQGGMAIREYEDYDSLSSKYSKDQLDNALNSMITVSDNDAANTLVNYLGGGDDAAGMARVNKFCQDHGYTSTSMGRLLLADNSKGDNYTSAKDCGKFLKTIYQIDKGTATDNNDTLAGAEYMYRLLKMQTRKNKIPAQMPSEVKVANKTGELDHVENDVGIIYDTAKGIDLVVCFMSQDLNDTSAAQNTIAQDSRAIYGYYNE